MDINVKEAQRYLNAMFAHRSEWINLEENGKTGTVMMEGLIRAFQLQNGISPATGFVGEKTITVMRKLPVINKMDPDDEPSINVALVQCALFAKGYHAGGITGIYYNNGIRAVKQLQNDAGITVTGRLDWKVWTALFSMNWFQKVLRGSDTTRQIQRQLNADYSDIIGVGPCDGVVSRQTALSLVAALQAEEKLETELIIDLNEVNFGPNTTRRFPPVLKKGQNSDYYRPFNKLVQYGLYFNGYNPKRYDGIFDEATEDNVRAFQTFYGLLDIGLVTPGQVNVSTMKSLLTSKGDTNRKAKACDTRFEISEPLLRKLKADGYQIVGRYLTGGSFKEIREGELERIVKGGLQYFPIFQENGRDLEEFTYEKGIEHGKKASRSALIKGVPSTVIYFAVDMDIYDYQIDSHIIPYFKGINETIDARYSVGIYASRNVCTRVSNVGYAVSSFVSDMSTGFSGNLGFPIPENWNYDQFHEVSGYGGQWDLDKVASSGRIPACSIVLESSEYSEDEPKVISWIKNTEKECLNYFDNIFVPLYGYQFVIGRAIFEYLRKPEYWGDEYVGLWQLYTPEIGIDVKEVGARTVCQTICLMQPNLKRLVSSLDIAHMAATALGYIHWGISNNKGDYSLGDLGGWLLDLLQMWGYYCREADGEDLELWLKKHLGSKSDGKGFGYDDILADADAYLIANYMQTYQSKTNLSEAVTKIYKYNKNDRIKMFYKERFDAKKENVISGFIKLSDGIDYLFF